MASDVLTALHERNRASAAACCTARMHETLLQDYNALEKTAMQCERLQQEADTANAAAVKAAEATHTMGQRLEEALARAADLDSQLKQVTASEAALKAENEALILRLTEQLQIRAQAMDSELEEHEHQRISSEVAAAAAGPAEAAGSTV